MSSPTASSSSLTPTPAPRVTNKVPRKLRFSFAEIGLPLLVAGAFLMVWHWSVRLSGGDIFPKPIEVFRGIVELVQKGLLVKYVIASLFRVTWGFTLAVLVGVPFGLLLGWYSRSEERRVGKECRL